MLVYSIFKHPVRWAFPFFYKRMYIVGMENILLDQPTIIAPNHANTLIDPIAIACYQPMDMYFWARADVFKHPVSRWICTNVHMLPIFRPRDGKENMHKNDDTFKASSQVLAANNMLFISPEGNSKMEKRLRPMKLGPARLLFDCLEAYPDKEFYIQPMGLNYTELRQGWGDFMMVYGKPIAASDYLEMYKENPDQAKEILMADVRKGLLDVMLHIDTEENEPYVEGLWELYRNDYVLDMFPKFSYDGERFKQEQAIARQSQIDPYEDQWESIKQYFETLKANNLNDFAIANFPRNNFSRYLFVLCFLPIKILSLFLTLPILKFIQNIANTKVADKDFAPSVVMVGGMVFFSAWGLFLALIAGVVYSWWLALLMPILVLFTQYMSQYWNEEWQKIKYLMAWSSFRKNKPNDAEKLEAQRADLRRYYEQWI